MKHRDRLSKRSPKRQDRARRVPETELGWWRLLDVPLELLLLAVLALSPWLAASYQEGATLWFDLLLVLGVLVSAVRQQFERVMVLGLPRWLLVCLGALALMHVISIAYSVDRFASAREALRVGAAVALAMMVGREAARSEAFRSRAVAAVALGAAVPAALGIRQYMINLGMGESGWRTFGSFASPNSLAGHLILALPLALALPLGARQRHARMAAWLLVGLIAACLPLTSSKAGLLAFVTSVGVYVVLRNQGPMKRRLAWGLGAVAGLVALVLCVPAIRGRVLATLTTQNHSWMFRAYTWKASAATFAENALLGSGAGTFSQTYLRNSEVGPTQHAHNCYLELGCDVGLIGLAAMVGVLVLTVVWAARRSAPEEGREGLFRARVHQGVAAALVASAVHCVFDYDWYIYPTFLAFAAAVGLVAAPHTRGRMARASRRLRPAPLLVGVVCVLLVVWAGRLIAAQRAYDLGRVLTARGNPDLAQTALRRATALAPSCGPYWRALGRAQRYEPGRGREAFERAIACQPEHNGNHVVFANVLTEAGLVADAAPHFERALELYPSTTPALVELAAIAHEAGDVDARRSCLERLMRLEDSPYGKYPAVPETLSLEFLYAHAGLAELLCEQNGPDSPEAAAELDVALARTSGYLAKYDARRAQLEERYGKLSGSTEIIRSFLEISGFTPERVSQAKIMHAALLMLRAGSESAAEDTVSQARNIHPDTVRAIIAGDWPGILKATRQDRLRGGL